MWTDGPAENAGDTHILGDDYLLEVVATDLPLVSHRLPEQLLQPLKIALVDAAGGPTNTAVTHVHERNATPNMRMTKEKHVLVLNTVFVYSFSTTCTSSTRSSLRLLLLALSISLFDKSGNILTYNVKMRRVRATTVAVDKQ